MLLSTTSTGMAFAAPMVLDMPTFTLAMPSMEPLPGERRTQIPRLRTLQSTWVDLHPTHNSTQDKSFQVYVDYWIN